MSDAWIEAAQAFADLEDGDGVEDRLPAASRIPHAADGLVRAAAFADPSAAAAGKMAPRIGDMPDVRSLRIPLGYLANLLTAGKEEPVALALERMLAMRAYMRAKTVDGVIDERIARACRPLPAAPSRTCTRPWPSPITRTASSSRRRTARPARMPTTCAAPAASRSATAVRQRQDRARPVRDATAAGRSNPMEVGMMTAPSRRSPRSFPIPREALQAATGEFAQSLAEEASSPRPQRAAIRIFLDELAAADIYELQEQYFALFDRSRRSRCISSSMCMARAVTADRPWST